MSLPRVLGLLVALVAALGLAAWLLTPPAPAPPAATLAVGQALGGEAAGFARALAPRAFAFPADHGPHPAYRTEWWYWTGNLLTGEGRHFGYQLTFFRVALRPEGSARASAWAARDVYLAHLALTDTAAGRFHAQHRAARGAMGLAGARGGPFRVWLEDWAAEGAAPETFPLRLRARGDAIALDLRLAAGKPPVLQGELGLSRKGPEPGQASYYYSLTRLPTRGLVEVGGAAFDVAGLSWMDREWSTSALGALTGWDWFALQLEDGRDLMVYRLRQADGTTSPWSAGTLVGSDGRSRPLGAADAALEVLDSWTSPRGGARYPARWRLSVPSADLVLEIVPRLADQEHPGPLRYWEGAVTARGTAGGARVAGQGYVELVGYAAPRERARAAATSSIAPTKRQALRALARTAGSERPARAGSVQDADRRGARRSSGSGGGGGDGGPGQGVHPLVERVAGVAAHLVPDDVVPARLRDQRLPEVAVGHRLAVVRPPAVPLPALPPAVAEAVHDVGAVAVDVHAAAAGHGAEPLDGGRELHALVGAARVAARDHALGGAVADDGGPAARSGVTGAGAVRVDDDVGHRGGTAARRSGQAGQSCQ